MKTHKLLIAAALLVFFTSAHAFSRLGESPQEIEARYGHGQKIGSRFPNSVSMKYGAKGFEINVHFLDGRSAAEQFKKHGGGRWSDKEITDFLKTSFSLEGEWTYSESEQHWYHGDKMTVAYREPGHGDWFWIEDREKVHTNASSAAVKKASAVAAPAPPPVTPETQQRASDILKANHGNFVFISGKEGDGSGFIAKLGNANFLVTNAHVAAGINELTFKAMDGTAMRPGSAAVAVGADIFCMQMPNGGDPLEIMQRVDENAAIGDDVVVLGNAEGAGVVNTIIGKIVGIGPNLVEVNAPFVPGNSGSPVIHMKSGKVIGVATYTVTQKYDAITKEEIQTPVIRRFAYRLDVVKAWQPVNWQTFYAQAAEMQSIEKLTNDLGDFFRDLGENNGRVTVERYTNPVIKSQIDQWLAHKTSHISASDAASADASFISFLKIACESDVAAAARQMSYDYFQRELADEKATRDEMAKSFEELVDRSRH